MSEKKVFCEECRDDVDYSVVEKKLEGKIKNVEYTYIGHEAVCVECGSNLYVPEIIDSNLKSLYDVYRKENNIVSLDTILAIPEKYFIGKRPLSLLLGWGEQTFSRYIDGDIPTKQYSDILQQIYDNPSYYLEILESNKSNLPTVSAYEKSKNAVNRLLTENDTQKIDIVIQYLLSQCEDITPLALQKILYYIQGFYYAFYNNFIFEEDCEAWVHGPVYRDIYNRYSHYRFDHIKGDSKFDTVVFSTQEKAIIDSIIRHFACYSGKVLESFTHTELPWLLTRGDLPETESSDKVIEKNLIGDYFSKVKSKYEMLNPNDIMSYTQVMFNER